ncbi:D-lactate dehydrogenase [Brevundimonas sp.]|uniref:D-lactate dehydrogenase n=1 Tax=Brevundimonas sp. TaxID=1871086 RepID=UPI003D10A45B
MTAPHSTAAPARPPVPFDQLRDRLRAVVGAAHVLTDPRATRRYSRGYRFGQGRVEAVVRPGSLVEQWRAFQACVEAGRIVIMQAANTGLTGGSTPDGNDYDRPVVVISTLRMTAVHLIEGGRQVICLPGASLDQLERMLKPLGREPHSVIGSSCIGASVVGGVCNNSGGSLIQRGPAYTQMALYARVGADGRVELVNHLGVALGDDPETVLARVEAGDFQPGEILADDRRQASDGDYARRVRDVDADSPARFNADPDRLFEASGSAGKAVVFAVRLDTFAAAGETGVFYIGASDPAVLTRIRRDILSDFEHLPVAGEYMHRDCYDIARKYGKDTFLAIRTLGTGRIGQLFGMKSRFDAFVEDLGFLPKYLGDRLLQFASGLFPEHLPARMNQYRDRFEHHLMLKMSGEGVEEARAYLARTLTDDAAAFFECTPDEGARAFLHRFAAAGAAVRYRAVHHRQVSDIVALDIALRRNDRDWMEVLPEDVRRPILKSLYYGHFFCHVFHQDYIVAKGHDPVALEHRMWDLLDQRRAAYPAEHNVGHLYKASPAQAAHFKRLDPCNCLNPGIGMTSRRAEWV